MIKSNFKSFQTKLNKNINAKIKKRDDFVKGVIVSSYNQIVEGSPVDTGFYKANHFIDINNPNFRTKEDLTPNKYDLNGVDLAKTSSIFVHTSVVYANELEEGHSKQNSKMYYKARKSASIKLKQGY
ncbi:MAG: hypothetical protein U9N59_08575 [Campylobacterota bacterium]|nr:hypothetical protein [Campylobacterota bacterium]